MSAPSPPRGPFPARTRLVAPLRDRFPHDRSRISRAHATIRNCRMPTRAQPTVAHDAIVSSILLSDCASWDTNPLLLPAFWANLPNIIPGLNAEYVQLIKYGTVNNRTSICVSSDAHSALINNPAFVPHSYKNPFPISVPSPPSAATPAAPPGVAPSFASVAGGSTPAKAPSLAPAPSSSVSFPLANARHIVSRGLIARLDHCALTCSL